MQEVVVVHLRSYKINTSVHVYIHTYTTTFQNRYSAIYQHDLTKTVRPNPHLHYGGSVTRVNVLKVLPQLSLAEP